MDNTKFTKGEWNRVLLEKTEFSNRRNEVQYGEDGECVAEFVENDYDALLISKAPKMLEMLKSVLEIQKSYIGSANIELVYKTKEIEQLIKEATEL